jgi:ribonuclease G
LPGYVVTVNAHPAVVDLLTGEEKAAVVEAERRYMRRIEFVARREYHIEQFDLQGR